MKSMAKTLVIVLLSMLSSASSCDAPWGATVRYFFIVENQASYPIVILESLTYPDTSLPVSKDGLVSIPSGEEKKLESLEPWEAVIPQLPIDTLSIFIFSRDTLLIYDWAAIRSGYKILDRMEISVQDIEDGRVTYPK